MATSEISSPRWDDFTFLFDRNNSTRTRAGLDQEEFGRDREQIHCNTTTADLIRLILHNEWQIKRATKLFAVATERHNVQHVAIDAETVRIHTETHRANEAERLILETTRRLNQRKMALQQEAVRAKEELRLYRIQFETAEIQSTLARQKLREVQERRKEAEVMAESARTRMRKFELDRILQDARDEGFKSGFDAGVRTREEPAFRYGYDQAHSRV